MANIASLGQIPASWAAPDTDDAARALTERLNDAKVRCDFVGLPTHLTITKLRVLSRSQQLIRPDFEEGFGCRSAADA